MKAKKKRKVYRVENVHPSMPDKERSEKERDLQARVLRLLTKRLQNGTLYDEKE